MQQQEELEEVKKKPLPEAQSHTNNEIRDFLLHFQSERLLYITCADKSHARKRDDQEKQSLVEQR